MPVPKITERTTLAELSAILKELGDPFLTLSATIDGERHAIAHSQSLGTHHATGKTEAEALGHVIDSLYNAREYGRAQRFRCMRCGTLVPDGSTCCVGCLISGAV